MARVHHMGITVSDTERTVAFYRLLAEVEVTGPLVNRGPAVDAVTGTQGAEIWITFIVFDGGSTMIELAEYRESTEVPLDPVNSRVGATHPAIIVPDIEAAIASVVAAGYSVTAPAQRAKGGPIRDFLYTYVIGPDQLRVELMQEP